MYPAVPVFSHPVFHGDKKHPACWYVTIILHLKSILKQMATIKLTTQDFKDKVFNYEGATEWSFKGERPAIIDFYADWCGPCKFVAPILEQLSEEYKDQLDIYKVDTDAEQELSAVFGIQSIPSLLFVPMEGKPMMQAGALPKNVLKEVIEKELVKPNAISEA